MMKVTIISPSKMKEKYLKDAQNEYQKRLSRYCDLNIIEPEPVKLPDNPNDTQIAAALEREAEVILKKIPPESFVFALCVEGKPLSSEKLAKKVNELSNAGKPLCLIIGSSYGLSESVKQRADFRLSVSDMTFPHQLFRVMLLEQLYRSYKINEGSTYHK